MYCPDLNSIDLQEFDKNYDSVNLGESFVLTSNGARIKVLDLTSNGEVIVELSSKYSENTRTLKLQEGDLVEITNILGYDGPDPVIRTAMLEVCSVNNGYTLSEKSALFASDGNVQKFDKDNDTEEQCILGEKTGQEYEHKMEDNLQRIYNTWRKLENCGYTSDKVIVKSESVFDNVIQYGEGEYSISTYTPKLNLGESLELGDGNKLVLADLKPATEQDPTDRAIVSIENAQGEEITVKTIEAGITEIFAGGNRYTIEIKEVVPGFTLNEKFISEVKILNEKEELRRDTIMYIGPSEQWLLGNVSEDKIELYNESAYNPELRLNETMDLGDGNKLRLSDVMATLGGSPVAIVNIESQEGEILASTILKKGVTEVTVGSKTYELKNYKTSMNIELDDVYMKVGLINQKVFIQEGKNVNAQNIEITTTFQKTNFGINGFTLDMKYLDFEN